MTWTKEAAEKKDRNKLWVCFGKIGIHYGCVSEDYPTRFLNGPPSGLLRGAGGKA